MAERPRTGLTLLLVGLTIAVQVGAIYAVAGPLQSVDTPLPEAAQTAENDAASAVPIALLLVVELVLVFVAWWLYGKLPDWLRRWVKRGLIVGAVGYAILYALVIMPVLFVAYAAATVAYLTGYRWLAYDIAGLVLGVVIAATLGGWLGPVPLVVLLIGLMAYDHVAVLETDTMDRVVRLLAGIGLPAMVIVPKRLQFDLRAFLRELAADGADLDGRRDRVHTVIGVGDFALPAALAAAAFRFYGPAVALPVLTGTVIGMVLLTRQLGDDALPGLPWLGGGAIGGYAVAIIATGGLLP